jgi:hypothetical protein
MFQESDFQVDALLCLCCGEYVFLPARRRPPGWRTGQATAAAARGA